MNFIFAVSYADITYGISITYIIARQYLKIYF